MRNSVHGAIIAVCRADNCFAVAGDLIFIAVCGHLRSEIVFKKRRRRHHNSVFIICLCRGIVRVNRLYFAVSHGVCAVFIYRRSADHCCLCLGNGVFIIVQLQARYRSFFYKSLSDIKLSACPGRIHAPACAHQAKSGYLCPVCRPRHGKSAERQLKGFPALPIDFVL